MVGLRIWSVPEGHLIRTFDFGDPALWQVGEKHLLAEVGPGASGETGPTRLVRWDLPDGEAEQLGSVDVGVLGATNSVFDPSGQGWLYAKGNTIFYRPLPSGGQTDVVVGRHENDAVALPFHENDAVPLGFREGESDRVWSRDQTTREYRCWSLTNLGAEPLAVIPPPPGNGRYLVRDLAGQWRFVSGRAGEGKAPELWYLDAPAGARTVPLRRNDSWFGSLVIAIHPAGAWMATPCGRGGWSNLVFWPLTRTYPIVVDVRLHGFLHGLRFQSRRQVGRCALGGGIAGGCCLCPSPASEMSAS